MKILIIPIVIVFFFATVPQYILAHELLPKNVVEYIQTHPDASAEDIEEFIKNTSPELAKKIRNKDDIARILNRKTNFIDNSIDFLKLGIDHILSGPDHILFVLSLLLGFTSFHTILKLTGTFTVAHSITLILAGFGILTLSSRIVEPFIALSITYVALTSVFLNTERVRDNTMSKIASVFFFGLFHGLGFAGILKEIQVPQDRFVTSLLSFNIGLELGQICIVLITLPFIYYFRKKSWYKKCIKISAVGIGIIGVVWAIQRVLM